MSSSQIQWKNDPDQPGRSRKRSGGAEYTTRIAEVENAGRANERVLPPDTGYGFLWHLYSYWRFQERKGGVCIECRAISLTRDMPRGLGWIIEPIIQKLPKESLINILEATRRALQAEERLALRFEQNLLQGPCNSALQDGSAGPRQA
jgi:hypothetical protein